MGRAGRAKRSIRKGAGLIGSVVGAVGDLAGTIVNKAVDVLPLELHVPGYRYCGPGTRLQERLRRGEPGVNPLDEACKQHDIAYHTYGDTKRRAAADKVLADRAWERVKASDASLGEKAAAWAVTNIMKAKSKFGGGVSKKRRRTRRTATTRKGKGMYLRPYQPKGCGASKNVKRRRQRQRRRRTQRN